MERSRPYSMFARPQVSESTLANQEMLTKIGQFISSAHKPDPMSESEHITSSQVSNYEYMVPSRSATSNKFAFVREGANGSSRSSAENMELISSTMGLSKRRSSKAELPKSFEQSEELAVRRNTQKQESNNDEMRFSVNK